MVHIKEIEKAIAAHGSWKADLRNAIRTGQINTSLETIRMEDKCVFGKWLDSPTVSLLEKASHHYKTVKEHHSEFHKTAAHVVELVLAGKNSDAERMISLGGEYARISAKLIRAMIEWKKSLG